MRVRVRGRVRVRVGVRARVMPSKMMRLILSIITHAIQPWINESLLIIFIGL